jgi:hypothetical protein
MKFNTPICAGVLFLPMLTLTTSVTVPVMAAMQQADPVPLSPKNTVLVEWVYRIQYGHQDEWWRIFKKYQIAILERQKQLGYVKEYTVFAPSLGGGVNPDAEYPSAQIPGGDSSRHYDAHGGSAHDGNLWTPRFSRTFCRRNAFMRNSAQRHSTRSIEQTFPTRFRPFPQERTDRSRRRIRRVSSNSD